MIILLQDALVWWVIMCRTVNILFLSPQVLATLQSEMIINSPGLYCKWCSVIWTVSGRPSQPPCISRGERRVRSILITPGLCESMKSNGHLNRCDDHNNLSKPTVTVRSCDAHGRTTKERRRDNVGQAFSFFSCTFDSVAAFSIRKLIWRMM